jgi:conjugative relaxase-like TrwC/TraI family protein
VLKIFVLHAGGHSYYLEGPQSGSDLEPPGIWSGPAAPSLGLVGAVEAGAFDRLMGGCDPRSGQALRQARGGAMVTGFDLTFCAPKSVSLLHALGPREIAHEVEAGHRAAVAEASRYLSRDAAGVRRVRGADVRFLPSTGMVAGEFSHRVSRALDPHLHTHMVTANLAEGADGTWSTLDGRRLFAHLRAAGRLYHASLRWELSERMGAAWDVRPSGVGDVAGVDPVLRRLFSQRTAAIDEYVRTRHGDDPNRHPGAFYATRPEKGRSPSLDALTAAWRQRAADFDFDLGELSAVVGRGRWERRGGDDRGVDPERLAQKLGTVNQPTGTVARRDLVSLVAASAVGGTTLGAVDGVVERMAAAVDPDPGLRRAREPRWSTQRLAQVVHHHGQELVADVTGDTSTSHRRPPTVADDRTVGVGRAMGPERDRGRGLGR